MKNSVFVFLFIFLFQFMNSQNDFLNQQLNNVRVQDANRLCYNSVKDKFAKKGIKFPTDKIFWRAFKYYKTLELWSYSIDSQRYIIIDTYNICETVGDLGPKRREGDFQIPEGFYYLDILNPSSKYHLSMHINYPNESDKILGHKEKLGGDIYVHGGCETIGCIPMTNDVINELYLVSLYAKAEGLSNIPIHIFPMRLTPKNLNKLKQDFFKGNTEMINFWNNLKIGFDYFEKNRVLPIVNVDAYTGKYIFE